MTGVNVIAVLKLLHLPLLHWTRALYSALQYRCERDCCAQAPPPAPPSLDARSLQCSPIQVWTWLLCSSSSTCPSFTGRALSTVLSNTGVNVIAVLKLLHLPLLHWTRALYSALQYRCERDCCTQAPPPAPPSLDARSLQCSPIQVWTWLLYSSSSTCPSFTGRASTVLSNTGVNVIAVLKLLHLPLLHWTRALYSALQYRCERDCCTQAPPPAPPSLDARISTVLSNTGVNVIAVLKLLHLPLLHWTRALYSALQYRCERDCCTQAPPPAPPSLDARSLQCSPIQVWTWLLYSSSSTCPSFTGRAHLYSALQYRCERDCCTQAPPPAPPSLDARSLQCSPIQVWTWLLCSSSSTCPSFTGRALSTVLSNTGVNYWKTLLPLATPVSKKNPLL